ncbi:hypothetical protein [Mesorhizobium sophorae]|uniref:hypothetical protein n=1 Tax=Mesorhizobium sophorae TaxID=1300294 RepID=UPI000BA4D912|nr:hypothetical protein [Mesorhizobium sophorae]
MLPLLQSLHLIAAKRGDGLRPEFLRMEAEEVLSLTFPPIQLASLSGDGFIPIQDNSVFESPKSPTPRPPKTSAKARGLLMPNR